MTWYVFNSHCVCAMCIYIICSEFFHFPIFLCQTQPVLTIYSFSFFGVVSFGFYLIVFRMRFWYDMLRYQVVFVQFCVFAHQISNKKCSYAYSFRRNLPFTHVLYQCTFLLYNFFFILNCKTLQWQNHWMRIRHERERMRERERERVEAWIYK